MPELLEYVFLSCRDLGQGSVEEVRNKDLKRELEDRERNFKDKAERKDRERERSVKAAAAIPSAQ